MTTLLLYAIIIGTITISLFYPWIGVLAYYTLALMFPQSIWNWIFGDLRVSLYISIAAIIGFIGASLIGKIDLSILKNKQNLYIIVLWLAIIASYIFSPYGVNESTYKATNSRLILIHLNKVFLFYFVSILLIDSKQKYHFLIVVFLVTILLYIYWANDLYLSGYMGKMGLYRLNGPGGIYGDENAFAMLFVMGIPFLYFMGDCYQNKFVKYLLWLAIPFAWHAIFLTGSRGGLIGIGVVTIFITLRSRRKILGLAVLVALIVAFIWQGGAIMKERSATILGSEEEEKIEGSAQGRLDAWDAGLKMMLDHPITGVGLGNFMPAFPDYFDKKARVAHNTVIQLASESGIVAGLMYLLLCLNVFLRYWRQKKIFANDPFWTATNEAVMCSLLGFFVCSLFLNLATYETFYYLLILSIVQNRLISKEYSSINSNQKE